MQSVGKEDKEKAKLEKQKEKEDKEKQLQEKREKAAKLKEEMQKVGKEKKKEEYETTTTPFIQPQLPISEKPKTELPTLFETLSKKTDSTSSQPLSFMPFTSKETPTVQEPSKLRIIPNVADFNNAQSPTPSVKPSSTVFDSYQQPKASQEQPIIPPRDDKKASKKSTSTMIICPQCGAMLSSEYAFCNKCGSKL
jgi:ribosomal protein L40E